MAEARLTGGSEADRNEILRLHERYIDVNTRFDWQNLQPLFSGAPEATYFNLNGHTYNTRDHWTRLWKFYGQNVSSTYWTPFDIGGVVTGDLAVVWCHRNTGGNGPARSHRPRTSTTATRSSSRARPWCSARRTANGGWCMRISRRPNSGPRPGGV